MRSIRISRNKWNVLPVREFMQRHPLSVHPDDDLFGAIGTLLRSGANDIAVTDEKRNVVGVLSVAESLKFVVAACYDGLLLGRVGDCMSKAVQSIAPDTPMREAVTGLVYSSIRYFPVIDSGALVGQLSQREVLNELHEWLKALPTAPVRRPSPD